MRFRASNLVPLLGIVAAIAAAVLLADRAQRGAADESSKESIANAQLQDATATLLETTEVYVASGERAALLPWENARRELERAIVEADLLLESEPREQELLAGQIAAIRHLQALGGVAIEARRAGEGPGTLEEQTERIRTFDEASAANNALDAVIEDARHADQRKTGLVSLVSVVVLGALILALGFAARRDDRRRRRIRRFGEGLQAARTEPEAYALVKSHLERSVPSSHVAIFNRNNSANRLEPSTRLDDEPELAEAVAGAQPDDCLAVRTAKPSHGGTDSDDLLRCEICGKTSDKALCVPSIVGGEVIGSVLVRRPRKFDEWAERAVSDSVSEAAPVVAHLRNLAIAERRAASDKLTGLPNKRSAEDTFKQVVANAARTSSPLALVMFDLDHFKRINDSYGHPKGDEVLAAVGAAIAASVRDNDFAARDGGEEFMLLLPGSDRDGGMKVAEKLRKALEQVRVPGVEQRITASFGVAALPDDAGGREELLRKADRALYLAKRDGRNRVHAAGSGDDSADSENGRHVGRRGHAVALDSPADTSK